LPKGVVFTEQFVSRTEQGIIVHLEHEGQETCRVHFVRLRGMQVAPRTLTLAR
jgi:hypothetical protein